MFKQRQDEEKASCPFNRNHIFAKEKLIFHINRCKDREKVKHKFAVCKYNGLHFIPKQDIEEHQLFCQDREEVRRMLQSMRRNYDDMNRERERSRDKKKKEIKDKDNEDKDDEDDHTLSECQQCQLILLSLNIEENIEKYPKLKKYLAKYQQLLEEKPGKA